MKYDIATSITSKKAESVYQLTVYPNPGSSLFTIQFNPEPEQTTYSYCITNTVGQTVYIETVKPTNTVYSKQINLSHLPKGTYYVNLYTNPVNATNEKQLKESRKIVLQ